MFFRAQLKTDNVMKTNIKNNNNNNNNNNNDNASKNNNNNIDSKVNINPKSPKVVKVVFDNRIKRKNVLALNEKVAAILPPPMTEIKKEIKEEPKDVDGDEDDDDDFLMADTIQIKKEYQSDDNNEEQMGEVLNTEDNSRQLNMENIIAESEAKNQTKNSDKLTIEEESTNDSLEDVALAKLQKRIKDENITAQVEQEQQIQSESLRCNNSPQRIPVHIPSLPAPAQPALRPMPPLIKAPIISLNTSHINRTTTNRRLRSQEDYVPLPAIRTCSEARTYLKLLEDFALERESFRLIGLITRADEVLRELDRKDHGSDDDDEDIE
uniref:Uncharacterized protein n=1 Tax=Glossina pallidipes TaxID=7398 RepID=A0A1A9ZMN8_GLOPL